MAGDDTTESALRATAYSMLVITSTVFIARLALHLTRRKALAWDDYWIILAYAFFLALVAMYIVIIPILFKTNAVAEGKLAPYPALLDEATLMLKILFPEAILFWCVLWSVKFSLLALYKRLMQGTNTGLIKAWWAVVVFLVLTWIGAVISNVLSCHSWHAWFTPGECVLPKDAKAQFASLYYTYAADVISDLAIMCLPIKLMWNLQMRRAQKLSIIALFCIGFVCVIFATIRVVRISVGVDGNHSPKTTWIILWAIIEAAVAVIIGCCPAFYVLISARRNASKPSYNSQGYHQQPSHTSAMHRSGDIKMESM
ncbi:hypothetical protein P154DRAFT_533828 [Amniculicola lignicola CBS 123094]|uniref:Rhodopsin domain-containing protein n=1 Tax=Amniculicola lignicola CBS 123094 TaxID=1392246 RepID=A0A6A5WKY4_9PLEO|nr:hypothetical protein P154DRAFT_533828 [Amniculicola lignicola CBS 123094]